MRSKSRDAFWLTVVELGGLFFLFAWVTQGFWAR